MIIQGVSPTRVNLLNLKQKVKTAEKGYKLLKNKRDGLMKKFMEIIKDVKNLRDEINKDFGGISKNFINASLSMNHTAIKACLLASNAKINISTETKNIMGVKVPVLNTKFSGEPIRFSDVNTSMELKIGIKKLKDLIEKLIKLAELEKVAENLAAEIEVTRRRVNTLENKMIPDLKDTIGYIKFRLEELAKSALVTVMKIKSTMEKNEKSAV